MKKYVQLIIYIFKGRTSSSLRMTQPSLSFSVFLSFLSRLKTLTTESSVIVAALQKSKTGLLEISEDKTKIRRSPDKPLPEMNDEYKDALKHKSVYIVRTFIFYSAVNCNLLLVS